MKLFWILVFGLPFLSNGQPVIDLNGSIMYGLPRFDSYFRGGYESEIGFKIRLRSAENPYFRYGLSYENQPFRKIFSTPVDVENARVKIISGTFSYNVWKNSANRIEPTISVGYSFISYNKGEYIGKAFVFNPGLQLYFSFNETFGLETGLSLNNIFDRFGHTLNPGNSQLMQYVLFFVGLTFDVGTGNTNK